MCFVYWCDVYLSCALLQGEEEENNEDDEEEDAGWMVPHGYLSEGEGCEDDEEVIGSGGKTNVTSVHPTKFNPENAYDFYMCGELRDKLYTVKVLYMFTEK